MNFGVFCRFVRLFSLCDLAWKSSLWLNKICSRVQIFFSTFQFQVSKVKFWHHFGPFKSFSISSSPIFFLPQNSNSAKLKHLAIKDSVKTNTWRAKSRSIAKKFSAFTQRFQEINWAVRCTTENFSLLGQLIFPRTFEQL